MTIEELFIRGGSVVWILAAYSSLGLGIVLERLVYFLRLGGLPRGLRMRLRELLWRDDGESQLEGLRGPEANIIHGLLEARQQGVCDLQRVGERIHDQELQRMEFGVRTLGILGNTAPLLGLLGTITGMIKAFMVIEAAGGKVDAQALAGGIWEAMITTSVGLAVAIPLVLLLHFLEGMVERRAHSMQQSISLLLDRHSSKTSSASAAKQPHQWEEITDGI